MPSYCPKCGNKVEEDAAFCPKCGAIIKIEQAAGVGTRPARYRNEKNEKNEKTEKDERREKDEKNEKTEKHEKREHAFLGWLIGGLAVILIGVIYLVKHLGYIESNVANAFFLIFIGAIIIIGSFYGATLASRRHPKP